MKERLLLIILVDLIVIFNRVFANYGSTFRAHDGHLTIKAAPERNISIVTDGADSYFNLNGVNLMTLMTQTPPDLDSPTNYNIPGNLKYELDLIKQKISKLENDSHTPTPQTPRPPERPPTRRALITLRNKVRTLDNEVSRIMELMSTDECLSTPCQHGGTCLDVFDGFICLCPKNWGGLKCNEDVNECQQFSGTDLGCQNGATCINTEGSYKCVCMPGFYGIHCAQKTNDCSLASSHELCGHGTCTTSGNGIKCICDPGWKTDGINPPCNIDVNECETNDHRCSINPLTQCINFPGGYTCGSCPLGYSGNGFYCIDVDECQTNNGGCSTNPLVECINTLGSRRCASCPPGFSGNGINCQMVGLCQVNNGGCHSLATCISNQGMGTFVQCVCPNGYTGNGFGSNGCSALDPGAVVVPPPSVFPGAVSRCDPNPCVHGTCHSTHEGHFCVCNFGFSGSDCNNTSNICKSNPCLNGGTCKAEYESSNYTEAFRCVCPARYKGRICEDLKNECRDDIIAKEGFLDYTMSHRDSSTHRILTDGLDRSAESDINCMWRISTDFNHVIKLNFSKFNLQSDPSGICPDNSLKIYDGHWFYNQKIGTYCSTNLPNNGTVLSATSYITLSYHSKAFHTNRGFNLSWTSEKPSCGGFVNVSKFGIIKSDNYPKNYKPNEDCYWKLITMPGKIIQFHSFSLHMESHTNCLSDYLKFYNGIKESDQVLAEFCTTNTKIEPFMSLSNEVLIHFHTDNKNSDIGFQLSYTVVEGFPGCGGVYTLEKGEIKSPSVDGQYYPNLLCEYKIILAPGTRIKLTYLEFNLESSTDCMFDNVAVYDGETTDSQLLQRSCGNTHPGQLVSNGNKLLIVFTTDISLGGQGFKIQYEIVCHQTFTALSGQFSSPGYPRKYPNSRTCTYDIRVPVGHIIELSFNDFNIEGNSYPDCNYDYLKIFDGFNETATSLGQFCGPSESAPGTIISTHNMLLLKFVTDRSVSGTGFLANYTTIDLGCGGIYMNLSGAIQFPDPKKGDKYQHNQKCQWVISAPPAYAIRITWFNFELEKMMDCSGDYVEVFDNKTDFREAEKIGRYCGNQLPPAFTSTSNVVTIKFVSDLSINGNGFSLSYTMIDVSKLCGANYHTTEGIIYSPGWPQSYPAQRNCEWIITVPNGRQIMLNFTSFDLENHASCLGDYLEIRNGGYKHAPLIGKYCGNKIPQIPPSMTNSIYLKFHSDISRSAGGFYLSWSGVSTGCGGILTTYQGTILSPNYPQPYGRMAMCFWKISVSAGSVIDLVIGDIELEDRADCYFDYVAIYDGEDQKSKRLAKLCTNKGNPGHIRTTSNHAYIQFRSDANDEGHGFLINYLTVCTPGTTTGEFSGVIESPGYPQPYPPTLDCAWTIQVPIGNKINASFSDFEIDSLSYIPLWRSPPRIMQISTASSAPERIKYFIRRQHNCDIDFVELSGTDPNIVQKYCGNTIPPMFTTDSNILNVRFVHKSLRSVATGFRLEWRLVGCGGILNKPYGEFSSPDLSNPIRSDLNCRWVINAQPGESIELTIKSNIDMGECDLMSFDIYDSPEKSRQAISKICHFPKEVVISSATNYMEVNYTYTGMHRLGVKVQGFYKTVKGKCGGIFKTISGFITSPNYPNVYGINQNCLYFIEVPKNHVVSLSFLDFDIDYSRTSNCSDSIKIYNGFFIQEKNLLTTICGNAQFPNFTSPGNQIAVRFTTDDAMNAKGFRAQYKMGCGARIKVTDSGFQEVNSHDDLYATEDECTWILESENPGDKIRLTITELHFVEHMSDLFINKNCSLTFIELFDGDSTDAPSMGKYCKTDSTRTIISSGNTLTLTSKIIFRLFSRFSFSYTTLATACGGTLPSIRGTFTSPNYPESFPPNTDCVWTISTSPGNKASITFNDFDIPSSDSCDDDYMEIRQYNSSGNLLGVFCGNDAPTNISSFDSLWIKFHSTTHGKGFMATYQYLLENEIENDVGGQISNPLYPSVYAFFNQIIYWRVLTASGGFIRITFKTFELHKSSGICSSTLEVHDGYDDSAPILFTGCGYDNPSPLESTSGVVYVKLTIEDNFFPIRLLLDWVRIPKESRTENITQSVINCGYNSSLYVAPDTSKILQSPGYPSGYDRLLHCEWIFSTDPHYHLKIKFVEMSLEEDYYMCMNDMITVSKSSSTEEDGWEKIQTLCLSNSTMLPGIETGSLMKVNFDTDISQNKSGFYALIYSVCGGTLKEPNGVLHYVPKSITFPFNRALNCQWNVTVRPGRTIKVQFTEFNVVGNPLARKVSCQNYVILRNGHFETSPFLGNGKYCGGEAPTDILTTTGNHLYISSYFDKFYLLNNSFTLTYSEISPDCDQEIMLTMDMNQTVISSPNYPNIPNPHIECTWIIKTTPSHRLRVDFVDRFDLTSDSKCSAEYVEILDGATDLSNSLGKFCSNEPATLRSTANILKVHYFTDINVPRNGFKANISIDICGGTTYSLSGSINYPAFLKLAVLNTDLECLWHIKMPPGHTLWLNLEQFSLHAKGERGCEFMTLQIFDKDIRNNTMFPLTDKICETPHSFQNVNLASLQTTSNEAFIKLTVKKGFFHRDDYSFSVVYNASRQSCAQTLTGSSGVIEHSHSCVFETIRITSVEGTRITVELLETSNLGTITFYDGGGFSYIITTGKPNTLPRIINSSENNMLITVLSRGIFKAKYTSDKPSVCQEGFSGDGGTINPPAERNDKYICHYKYFNPRSAGFGLDTNHTLVLKLQNATLSDRKMNRMSCRAYSRIEIWGDAGRYSDFCDNYTEPQVLMLPFKKTIVTLIETGAKMNFSIDYKVNPCGGFAGSLNFINGLKLPENYTGQIDCAWSFTTSIGSTIEVSFGNVVFAKDCSKEYLVVRGGTWKKSPVILRYCKDKTETKLLTTPHFSVYFEYHSDDFSPLTKLDINATVKSQSCGGVIMRPFQSMSSPNFPNRYSENQECQWTVIATKGNSIVLTFTTRFSLQSSPNCSKDFVEIFNYINGSYASVGKYCGRNMPEPVKISSGKAMVLFRSDESVNGDGFKILWSQVCGGTYQATDTPQVLMSPGFPGYKPNLKCIYNITAPSGKYINLNFTRFLLENGTSSSSCTFDNLTIIDENDYYEPKVFCGNTSPGFMRMRNKVDLVFFSDTFISRAGFMLYYSLDACGGNITSPTIISSPRVNNQYHNNLECIWNITAPKDKIVLIRFEMFVLEHTDGCGADSVTIYDAITNKTEEVLTTIATLCGNQTNNLPTIKSTTNKVIMELSTDVGLVYNGFTAAVMFMPSEKAGCGGTINLNENGVQTLEIFAKTPYDPFEECHWLIKTSPSKIISLEFTKFDIAPCFDRNETARSPCSCDYLEVRDGGSIMSPLIGKFCGNSTPNAIISMKNKLWIRFTSDGVLEGKGAKITVKSENSRCGENDFVITKDIKHFKTPNYDDGVLPKGLRCLYKFKTEKYGNESILDRPRLHFRFMDMDIGTKPINGVCNDFIQIYDEDVYVDEEGFGEHVKIKGRQTDPQSYPFIHSSIIDQKYCGNHKPEDIFQFSDELYILLVTSKDVSSQHKGIDLEYSLSECSRNFTGNQGKVEIFLLDEKNTCDIIIKAPKNRTISLYRSTGHTYMMLQDCSQNSIEIRDGNSTLLGNSCDNSNSYVFHSFGDTMIIHAQKHGRFPIWYNFIYTTTDQGPGCGGNFNFNSGTVTSPNFPNPYRFDGICTYTINVAHNNDIILRFDRFDIGAQKSCNQNYINIAVPDENKVSKFCPGDTPSMIRTNSNVVQIIHKSSVNTGDGFVLSFHAIAKDYQWTEPLGPEEMVLVTGDY